MKNTPKKKIPTAEEIAELAMKGKDVSKFFTNKGEIINRYNKSSRDLEFYSTVS